ncbi:MAG: uroporphyrinogen decarboxylase [Candidatus Competibacter sp.]
MRFPLKNDRLIKALFRQATDRTPIWLMRQAGRYLPEYRAARTRAGSFMRLCQTPELACEVTLQPLARFPLDAAILFSDILTVPDAMGLGLSFSEGEGPRFARPVRSAADIARLGAPDPEVELRYVMDAVRLIRQELAGRAPLIGFAGSPWTLATYMVEGGSSKDFIRIKGLLYDEPEQLHRLLNVTTQALIAYLNAQTAAGAQVLMVFDTWGGVLSPPAYQEFSLRYMHHLVQALNREVEHQRIPIILFTKGGGAWLEAIAATGCDAVGVDWTVDLGEARRRIGAQVALQGNLDPVALAASPARIRSQVHRVLDDFGFGSGHVFNLGHGIQPWTDPERVRVAVETVCEESVAYHGEGAASNAP